MRSTAVSAVWRVGVSPAHPEKTSNNRRDACWRHSQDGRAPINAAAIVVPALKRWAIVGDDRDRRSRLQLETADQKTPNAECMSLASGLRSLRVGDCRLSSDREFQPQAFHQEGPLVGRFFDDFAGGFAGARFDPD